MADQAAGSSQRAQAGVTHPDPELSGPDHRPDFRLTGYLHLETIVFTCVYYGIRNSTPAMSFFPRPFRSSSDAPAVFLSVDLVTTVEVNLI